MASTENLTSRRPCNICLERLLGKGITNDVDARNESAPACERGIAGASIRESSIDYNYDFKQIVRDICTSRT